MSGCNPSTHFSFSPQWFTPDGFRSLFALVGTNGQGIGTRLGENVPKLLNLSVRAGVRDGQRKVAHLLSRLEWGKV